MTTRMARSITTREEVAFLEAVRRELKARGLSVKDFCARAQIGPSALYRAGGRKRGPTLLTLARAAVALGLDLEVRLVERGGGRLTGASRQAYAIQGLAKALGLKAKVEAAGRMER